VLGAHERDVRQISPTASDSSWPGGGPVASGAHTLGILAIIFGAAFYSLWVWLHTGPAATTAAPERHAILSYYLPGVVYEWVLLFCVWRGARRRLPRLRDWIGSRWENSRQIFRDILIAILFWVVWYAVLKSVQLILGPNHGTLVQAMFPQGPAEAVVWILLSISSGFCEELVFRGYLLRQLAAWTGSFAAGVLLQAGLFGLAHPSLGISQMIVISVSGVMMGCLALWRRSLRPGIVMHAWADIFGGLLVKGLPYK
jgi:membrane protease YdiL (CAAX protease family)